MKRKKSKFIFKTKNVLCLFIGLLTVVSFFYACKKNESEPNNENGITDLKTIQALKSAYGFTTFDIVASSSQKKQIILSAESNSQYFNTISQYLNLNEIRLFTNKNDNTTVAIISYKDNINKSFALKGSFVDDKFSFNNDLFVEKNIEANGNVVFLVGKDKEVLSLDFSTKEGKINSINLGTTKPKILDLFTDLKSRQLMGLNGNIISLNDQYGNHGGNGFCQRERNENFSNCYSAEKEEFCDNFFSCLALDTQPQVLLLIAAACSCSASQSD
ncbi:hypothetical protein [Pedobacter mendelii]|uniref:Lipoprotein n=1 Tax=Pedobacter mendelii TaxID=1908240 RepID=A0ABQ2BCD0_9SPHI|nr:hypothetical protein [Pedobacter mendelii]GGI22851.1 hypothetical protein GCM10008119_04710 [Pedobacter mendelii]